MISGLGEEGFQLEPETEAISQCGFADIDLAIDVIQNGSFSDPVTLSLNGAPAGTAENFSTNPVTPPGSSTLTLGDLDQAGTGTFQFDLEGSGGGIEDSRHDVESAGGQPGDDNRNQPRDGSSDVSTTPTIAWDAVTGASTLTWWKSQRMPTLPTWLTVPLNRPPVTTWPVLDPATEYFVRVRADNSCGEGGWSTVTSFTTANQICIAPAASIPDDTPAGLDSDLQIASGTPIESLEMSIDITHTWVGDLIMTLTHVETGTSIELVNRPDGDSSFGCNSANMVTTHQRRRAAVATVGLQCTAVRPTLIRSRPTSPTRPSRPSPARTWAGPGG